MAFTVRIDTSGFTAQRRELEKRHIPFALASALTGVAQDAQAEVKRNVRSSFKLRNTWTENGIRIKAATPANLTATVYTATGNGLTPDYLVLQEEGGERVAVNGSHYLALPTKFLRQFAPGIIPAELKPRNLISATGGRFTYKGRKGQDVVRTQRVVRGLVFFFQNLRSGHLAILGRVANEKNARDVVPFYLLVPHAHVKKSGLRMTETVERVARERIQRQWDVTWKRLYANGLHL